MRDYPDEVKEAIVTIQEYFQFDEISDEDRMDVISDILDGYCKYCGSKYLPCYCWNDE